jgi:lipoprotein-anchoring transpeptidase ErfK/SrfK
VRSRSFVAVVVFLVLLLGGAVGVYAYDRGHRDIIAKGVRVAGIDIGGLHPAQARARLRHRFLRPLARPVTVLYRGQRFVLSARAAKISADLDSTVDEALTRSRDGSIVDRVARSLTGRRVDADIQPRITFSRRAAAALVTRIAKTVDRPARSASLSFSASGLSQVPSHDGYSLDAVTLRARVDQVLGGSGGSRRLRAHVTRVRPKVTTAHLADRYPVVVIVDRSNFKLRLFKRLQLVKTYPIAVGRQGLETPAGLYPVQDKQVNPSWHVPKSSWAGSLAGRVIPPGPADPIKARWIGITGGAGIHGTTEINSLGSAASHGCIRMAIPDVIELYDQVPYGSLIYVA